jgi:hypothetical protein
MATTMQHKIFCVHEFIKTESVTAVQRMFRLRQPVERAENLQYRNQLSGVCWGAVYCSIESIFLNHPVYKVVMFKVLTMITYYWGTDV